jgi:triosephosphate isomerase (TIM)
MTPLVVGNWKMHETAEAGAALARAVVATLGEQRGTREVDVVLAPPFTALARVQAEIAGTRIALGAQNMHWENAGAYTGEIAPPMLLELGVRYVILGHSERRRYFGETDEDVRRKLTSALAHGLRPIVAVGETKDERDAGTADERVTTQTHAALAGVPSERLAEVTFAYEPIWAIGTGRNCAPADAEHVMRVVKMCAAHDGVRVLYGGSATPANFAGYMALPSCDGGLIGGASLDAAAFARLVRIAGGDA